MADLVVQDIGEEVQSRLQARAARHGHSLEEEVRSILRDVARREEEAEEPLGTRIANRFRGLGLDEEIPEIREAPRPMRFDE